MFYIREDSEPFCSTCHAATGRCGPEGGQDLPEVREQGGDRSGRALRPPTSGLGLCPLLQFLVTGSLLEASREARWRVWAFLGASHTPSLLPSSRAALVPMFSFGENDLFDQVENSPGSWVRWIQDKLQKTTSFSFPLFHGRGIFQYSFGFIPYRQPITTVGEPRPRLGGRRLQGKGPGLCAAGDMEMGPHGAHILDWETGTQADSPSTRQSGMRTVTEAQRTMVTAY